ncbi:glycosyltransferase [Kineococcus aurantiacus]|uniref:GT2 family glycosyltransferase n=1 Tax=Kineococcus aurantiacus TaxID=37633 RepID=A0A7Y9ATH0_9ACTN|nr:GT2 family glycosyltransferase [Kineococcus aurantiacus]
MTTSSTWPAVAVVVPAHASGPAGVAELGRCLRALRDQDYPGPVRVLVVDNASTADLAPALPDDARFALLSEPVPGSYRARNRALAALEDDPTAGPTAGPVEVVAFTDADCTPEPDWLTRGVEALRRTGTGVAMVGGAVELTFAGGTPRTAWELYEAAHAFPQQEYLAKQHFAVTANLLTWRSTLAEVGPFDASLTSRGDAEWGQRVRAHGGAQGYAADAVVHHPARSTWPAMVSKTLRVARGRCDVDTARGRGRRHFAGVAAAHVRLAGQAVVRPPVRDGVLTSPGRRARYLLAHTTARVLFVGVNLRSALRSGRPVTGSGRPPTLPA